MSAREELARRVLEALARGLPVPVQDAIQLRNWAVRQEDILLSLDEIARRVLDDADKQRGPVSRQA